MPCDATKFLGTIKVGNRLPRVYGRVTLRGKSYQSKEGVRLKMVKLAVVSVNRDRHLTKFFVRDFVACQKVLLTCTLRTALCCSQGGDYNDD